MKLESLILEISKYELHQFYGWWQFGVCLFAAIALLAIWFHIGRRQKDFGQVWLAISVLCWSISGLIDVWFSNQFLESYYHLIATAQFDTFDLNNKDILHKNWEIWASVLSLFNSLFILLALPWFRYIPKKIGSFVHSKYWIYIVGLPFVFCLLPTLSKLFTERSLGFIREADVYYSILTLVFLGIAMWSSFDKRRLPVLAWLSIFCVLITLIAQVFKVVGSDFQVILFSSIFKTSLIMIFFALALSWVKELTENAILNQENTKLKLWKEEIGNNRHSYNVFLALSQKEFTFEISETYWSLLNLFIERKISDNPWLEIKPKNDNRSGKVYEITDYNQIKRLIKSLLDGMYGKGNWSAEIHGQPLKELLLEKSETKPRLFKLNHKIEVL